MPKTARNLWEHITSFDNLLAAFRAARRGKRLRPEVLAFEVYLEEQCINLQNHLLWKSWRPGAWTVFQVHEPKTRTIHAPPFADRVVHHALVRVIEPHFERRFMADSFACRAGKGTHAASARLTAMLRDMQGRGLGRGQVKGNAGPAYFLKADIAGYFPNINHDILLELVRRTVGDRHALWLLDTIVRDSGFDGVGLPIGALSSQLLANVYLDALDHHVKDVLGLRYYVRYMDDFIILHPSKDSLRGILDHVRLWLWDNLRLRLNGKTGIAPLNHGVDFAGYRHWPTHKLPRKRNVAHARRVFRRLAKLYADGAVDQADVRPVVASFCGYMQHCAGHMSCGSALENLKLRRLSL